jgi:hypothetical protein
MALGKRYVYALSYTGEKQYYERFQPEFALSVAIVYAME